LDNPGGIPECWDVYPRPDVHAVGHSQLQYGNDKRECDSEQSHSGNHGGSDSNIDRLRADFGFLNIERGSWECAGIVCLDNSGDIAEIWDSQPRRDFHTVRHSQLQHGDEERECDSE
jgi:hypothetical protein